MAGDMFDTPASVKSLRRYWKDRAAALDLTLLNAELGGESDRACVILITAMLDDVLSFYLSNRFVFVPNDREYDYIFRFGGPLGSFSSRIEVAYLFGHIDDITRSQLDDLREMRNACAHSKRGISFSTPELANVAKRLFHPKGVARLTDGSPKDIRGKLMVEVAYIFRILAEGSREKGIAAVNAELMARFDAQPPSPGKPPQQ